MKKNLYRVTVESVNADGVPLETKPCVFTARSHDDLHVIVGRACARGILDTDDDSAAMAVGLKLLGEIALEHRNEPLFQEIYPQLGAFIQKLKADGKPQ
jgi:hypothetical protein